MKNHAVIIGNGDPPSASLFLDVMSTLPTLICADGGLRTVLKYGFEPDVVIGDLDSVEISDLDRIPNEKIFKVDADNTSTDLQKAIKHAINQLRKGDLLIIAGKGHEKNQIINGKAYPFDDVKISKGLLKL